jgi:predicted HD superfamily hydrolase involved in NAD metabolism
LNYRQVAAAVRAHLDQKHRYEHVVRVARCADILAQRHGLDANKARLAGMLHDLARLYLGNRLISECEARHMPISAFERENPIVLHARLGAALATEIYGVNDPEVLSAIAKHTVAAQEMSPLDCTLYLAASLEPGRDYAERASLWALAQVDLNAAMHGVIEQSLAYLSRKGIPAAPETLAAAKSFGVTERVLP